MRNFCTVGNICKVMTLLRLMPLLLLLSCSAGRQGQKQLIGQHSLRGMKHSGEFKWLEKEASLYKPNPHVLDSIRPLITKDISFLLFGGAWCSDTRDFLPK